MLEILRNYIINKRSKVGISNHFKNLYIKMMNYFIQLNLLGIEIKTKFFM